jgi:nitroimidazol reductase NimA-like FMN-containing flavoprotein (pyridoxamine 5'-phosphate oxidase superfamily)
MMRMMRRSDRSIPMTEALNLLQTGEYGVLSTVGEDGLPYGVPLSYVLIDQALYFHSAMEGHKLDNLTTQPNVSFCVVGNTQVLPARFTTAFESVIVMAKASEVFGSEKQVALEALIDKYSNAFKSEGLAYIEKAQGKTRVIKLTLESVSGKARRI